MGYLVTTVNNLKAIPCDSFKLRWVNEMNSWYRADPASTGTPDNNRIIQPNTGDGRWVKQISQQPALAYTVQEVTVATTVNAATQVLYVIDGAAIGSDCTVNLPPSPGVGDSVGIIKKNPFNFSEDRVVINPGANNIEGLNTTYYLLDQNSFLELIWVGGTFGWLQTRRAKLYSLAGSFSFSPPAGLLNTTTFNGIFEFAGKGYSTLGTWSNPFTADQIIITMGALSTFSNTVWFDRAVGSASTLGSTGLPSYWLVSFENLTKYATVQLSHMLAVFSAGAAWAGITLLGSNSDISSIPNYGSEVIHNNRQDFMVEPLWEVIYKHNEAADGTSIVARSDSHLGAAVTLSAAKHYRHLLLVTHQTNTNAASNYSLREIEFWGTVNVYDK